jgi:hypothetical protein
MSRRGQRWTCPKWIPQLDCDLVQLTPPRLQFAGKLIQSRAWNLAWYLMRRALFSESVLGAPDAGWILFPEECPLGNPIR